MVKLISTKRKPQKHFSEETERKRVEELKEEFGEKKKLPRGYELQALMALSFYPELKNVSIEFEFKDTDLTLSAKPVMLTTILTGENRKYKIIISKKAKSTKEPIMLRNLPFDIQVGVIGHELGHIASYVAKNTFEVIKDGLLYGISPYKRKLEKSTDRIAIRHGLGYQILAYAKLVEKLKMQYPDEVYYQDYTKYYMSVAEIEAKMAKLKLYEGTE